MTTPQPNRGRVLYRGDAARFDPLSPSPSTKHLARTPGPSANGRPNYVALVTGYHFSRQATCQLRPGWLGLQAVRWDAVGRRCHAAPMVSLLARPLVCRLVRICHHLYPVCMQSGWHHGHTEHLLHPRHKIKKNSPVRLWYPLPLKSNLTKELRLASLKIFSVQYLEYKVKTVTLISRSRESIFKILKYIYIDISKTCLYLRLRSQWCEEIKRNASWSPLSTTHAGRSNREFVLTMAVWICRCSDAGPLAGPLAAWRGPARRPAANAPHGPTPAGGRPAHLSGGLCGFSLEVRMRHLSPEQVDSVKRIYSTAVSRLATPTWTT